MPTTPNTGIRHITCPCNNTEDMPIHEQRHHSQHFAWIENTNSDVIYPCLNCGDTVISNAE